MNYSPLRYPGGKSKIAPLIRTIMQTSNNTHTTYIEPFAGSSNFLRVCRLKCTPQSRQIFRVNPVK